MAIIRSPEWSKNFIVNIDHVINLGYEKSFIIAALNKLIQVKKENMHMVLPFIPKEEFYQHLDELMEMGHIVYEEI